MTPPVFFDIDGTLTDSSAGMIGSLQHAQPTRRFALN